MGLLVDYKTENPTEKENISLEHFPPEPHFCQPIAQSLSSVVRDSTQLPFLPSSHYHPHDFGMADTNDILVIVGEILSGNCFGCEYDKTLPGLGRCLSVYESGISFVSSADKTVISYARFATKKDTSDRDYPFLDINRVEVECESYKQSYHFYIDHILSVLEVCCIAFVQQEGNSNVMPSNHPAINPSNPVMKFDYSQKSRINMPGVYMGLNSGYVYHEAKGLYSSYIKGWNNKGILRQAVDLAVTDTDALALPDNVQESEKGSVIKVEGDPDPSTEVANYIPVGDELTRLLNMDSKTHGTYPFSEIERTGVLIPKRMSKFCVEYQPDDGNDIDSDEEEGSKRDLGAVILWIARILNREIAIHLLPNVYISL